MRVVRKVGGLSIDVYSNSWLVVFKNYTSKHHANVARWRVSPSAHYFFADHGWISPRISVICRVRVTRDMADDSTPALPPSTVLANLVFAIGARWAAWDAARAEAREALRR